MSPTIGWVIKAKNPEHLSSVRVKFRNFVQIFDPAYFLAQICLITAVSALVYPGLPPWEYVGSQLSTPFETDNEYQTFL